MRALGGLQPFNADFEGATRMSKKEILKLIHSTPEHYNPPNKYRRKLLRTLPIASREITALDLRLAEDPRTHPRDLVDILWRSIFAQWVLFGQAISPLMKIEMLVRLGLQHQDFMTLPEKVRQHIGDPFAVWKDSWAAEERAEAEEAANAQ
jgi:hypothetical protein